MKQIAQLTSFTAVLFLSSFCNGQVSGQQSDSVIADQVTIDIGCTASFPIGGSTESTYGDYYNSVATRKVSFSPTVRASYYTKGLASNAVGDLQFRMGFGLDLSLIYVKENMVRSGADEYGPSWAPWMGRMEYVSERKLRTKALSLAYVQSFSLTIARKSVTTWVELNARIGIVPTLWQWSTNSETGIRYNDEPYSLNETSSSFWSFNPSDGSEVFLAYHLVYGVGLKVNVAPTNFRGVYFFGAIDAPLSRPWQNGYTFSDQLVIPIALGVGYGFSNLHTKRKE